MQAFKNLSRNTLLEITTIAWPMALNAVLLQSVTIIDLLLIAPLGVTSVAAFGVASAIVTFILGIQMAFANGTQFVLSRAIGAGVIQKVGLEVAAGLIVNLSFSSIVLVALFFGAEPLVHTIIADDAVAAQATSYIEISLFLMTFSSVSQVLMVYFNSCKKTRIPLYGFLLEIPFNVISSAILIYGYFGFPAMGLAGAAWGSVAAIALRLMYLSYRFRREVVLGRVSGFSTVNLAAAKSHLDEVLPVVANFIVLLTGQMVFQILFAQLSVTAYAAITLVMPWVKAASMFVNAWAKSSTIMVSQFIGQGEFKRIPPFVLQSKFVATLMSFIMVLCFYLFSIFIPLIYTNLSPETVTALAIIAPAYIFIPIFRTNNMFCGNMMRALGESYLMVRINIVTMWCIALPTCALLIYFDAPLLMVFGVVLFDEVIKSYSFRKKLMIKLDSY
jgi:putative MATE family efflux protein